MQLYEIKKENEKTVIIYNRDKNPVITKIECQSDIGEQTQLRNRVVNIEIDNETKEMKLAFEKIPGVSLYLELGYEELSCFGDMKYIEEFFKMIQTIDPLPLKAYLEIKELIDFDLTGSVLAQRLRISQMVQEGEDELALQAALLADSKGDNEIMQILANLYVEKKDADNYHRVLSHYPKTHALFKKANEILHNDLLKDEKKHTAPLEKKFKYALNAELSIADNYYDMLCGWDGLYPKIISIKGDYDTLIKLADMQKNMLKELKELRKYKDSSNIIDNNKKSKYANLNLFKTKNIIPEKSSISNQHLIDDFGDIDTQSLIEVIDQNPTF